MYGVVLLFETLSESTRPVVLLPALTLLAILSYSCFFNFHFR